METQTATPAAADTTGQRDTRNLLPLWRITGQFTLKTPLSIGTGHDLPISLDRDDEERFVIAIARDASLRPYIPASSLKGALNELARRAELDKDTRERLFGREIGKSTEPGQVEFCNLTCSVPPKDSDLPNWDADNHPHVANLPHVVRDRDYGTAKDGLLFLEQVVPPGSRFDFECTLRSVGEPDIAALLGLLQLAGADDTPLRLGGGKAQDNGKVGWTPGEVRRLASLDALWKALADPGAASAIDLWREPFSTVEKPAPQALATPGGWLVLDGVELNFHTPFLSYQRKIKTLEDEKKGEADGKPRKNHHGTPVLPAASLHGALRAQAERILCTLSEKTPLGYPVPAVVTPDAAVTLDLASILFGAPGWRSLLRIGDFAVQGKADLLPHDMLAIDRLTGGGKDGAKFKIEALDCPILKGLIALDTRRLEQLEILNTGIAAQALGLLAHLLRDLDEGDIPLGYGAAKGYGRSTSVACSKLEHALQSANLPGAANIGSALAAFADAFASLEAPTTKLAAGSADEPAGPTVAHAQGDFHNPYVFIPFGKARKDDARLPWADYSSLADSHHSHARYHTEAFHGRLVCRLTTQTPIFIGAGDMEKTQDPKQKDSFRLNKELALPATSLRGMVSGLHEAITRSALRVMDDRHYSVRAKTEQSLKRKGKIVKINIVRDGITKLIWGAEDLETGKQYPISPSVKNRLELLCDERTEDADKRGETLPELKPRSAKRNPDSVQFGNKLRLVEGQYVFFNEQGGKITEMAYSQIWRKLVADLATGKPWMTGMALPDGEMAALSDNRTQLSPSELLFGCVQIDDDKNKAAKDERKIMAYASKVSFGFGRAAGAIKQSDDWITLKILASPKPPAPAMYFRPEKVEQGSYVSKAELSAAPNQYQLKGRKTYLHAQRTDGKVQPLDDNGMPKGDRMPWETAHPNEETTKKQKVRIRPIEGEFFFEVDFANLSQAELEALCASLAPHASHQHKLGMGKPIGLGSVKIDLTGLYLIDRAARYRDRDFAKAPRYATVWKDADVTPPAHFAREQAAPPTPDGIPPRHLANAQMAELKQSDAAVFNAILLTGNPAAVGKPVHYPQMGEKGIEEETFGWFVNNDKPDSSRIGGERQFLHGFTRDSTELPTLKRPKPYR